MVTLLDAVLERARQTPDIKVAALFGSQARKFRAADHVADHWSDVDLQIVTTAPETYRAEAWAEGLGGRKLNVYARRAVVGNVFKFTALYADGELDLVVVPHNRLCVARWLFERGWHRRSMKFRRAIAEFSDVMRFGQVVVKGGERWASFYQKAVDELPRVALNDEQARDLADIAYVDAVFVVGRIERGELIAAQRMLHQSVIEANIRLLHEWRERRGVPAFHRGRRSEQILPAEELELVRYEAALAPEPLLNATRAAVSALRSLVFSLTGRAVNWPSL